jgi:DNA-binding CsgD family transcriptional regulator
MTTNVGTLLGRSQECASLDGLLASVLAGESRALVLRGDPGVGKSALLNYVAAQADGWRITRIVGVESEMELAFSGLHQLCAPMLAHLERLPAPQHDALATVFGRSTGAPPDFFMVGLATLTLLAESSEGQPLLCIVDDAQWLDQASADVISFVARRLLAERIALVAAARAEVGDRVLAALPSLPVSGLNASDARALLLRAVRGPLDAAVAQHFIAESHGNPLAVLELARNSSAADLARGFAFTESTPGPDGIEQGYIQRLRLLPEGTQLLVLVAAAEPLGDPILLHRAAQSLGLDMTAADAAVEARLLIVGRHVEFVHPLVRSAAYRSASAEDRQRVHRALADATDAATDPDRRAWHRACGTPGPDEDIASELEQSAERAQARGGVAAAAAFLQRAVALTPDSGRRVKRALTAAGASLQAGEFDAALGQVAVAEAGATDDLELGRAALLRARTQFASRRGSDAPALLLDALQRIERLDPDLARTGYLEALSAALFAGRLAAPGAGARDVARAIQAAGLAEDPPSAVERLLEAWAVLFAEGCATAAPRLRGALAEFDDAAVTMNHLHLLWLVTITAPIVWDEARWEMLSRQHVELARSSGALSELPLALNSRIFIHLFRGELDTAAALIGEAQAAIEATGANLTPWGALTLEALRGGQQHVSAVLETARGDARARGEGIGLTVIAWARAVLHNGLGLHEQAALAAKEAMECPTNGAANAWAMAEMTEAAARVGDDDAARDAASAFGLIAEAVGGEWALGVDARCRALLVTGAAADRLYREAIERLAATPLRPDLARAHLLYGEWLRRDGRRPDAREHLQTARELFFKMGMSAFGHRAERELLAAGERARKALSEPPADLTPQESQIARLARDGLSNPEIGARLFLSARTVEWHLGKVFGKLGISSRKDLSAALPDRDETFSTRA